MDKEKKTKKSKSGGKTDPPAKLAETKFPKVIIPLGQVKLAKEDLERDHEITYTEVREKPGTLPKYYNVRKQKICKERNTCQVLLDLTPSVVYEHKEYPILVEPELPVTYFRDKHKLTSKKPRKVRVNLDDSDLDRKEDNIDSSSDSDKQSDKDVDAKEIQEKESDNEEIEGEGIGEEEEDVYEEEDLVSVGKYPHESNLEAMSNKSQIGAMSGVEMEMEIEATEDITPEPSWLEITSAVQEKPKSMFNFCEDVTQMKIQSMETYCGIQTQVPDLTHVGGKFCMASAYDAYVMFGLRAKKDPRGNVISTIEAYEKTVAETSETYKKENADIEIDFATLKIGRHDERDVHEDKDDFEKLDKNVYYEIDDIMSSDEDTDKSADSSDDYVASSSDDEEQEEPELKEDKDSESEEKTGRTQEAKKLGDDIDGYDLVPEDFLDPNQDKKETTKIKTPEITYENLTAKMEPTPQKDEVKLKTILTTAQKEQIVNHLLNPFDFEPVTIEKDEVRDINFAAPDSDDDVADNGEYLLAKYGTVARDLFTQTHKQKQEGTILFLLKERGSEEKTNKKKVEKNPRTTQQLRTVLEKQKHLMDLKKSGGVVIKNRYVRIHGITKDIKKDIDQLQIGGSNVKAKQTRAMAKLKQKRMIRGEKDFIEEKRIPKLRKLTNVQDPYVSEKRVYKHYVDEYKRLIIANRLIHHKQFTTVGWNFLEYEDNDDKEMSLYPLNKLPYFGSKESRITHMSWVPHLKHNLVISYESDQCAINSQWRGGHIVFSDPMSNVDYDHVYKFTSGVRYFDICNRGFMLVALEDGSILLVKIPFPRVIESTTTATKHSSAVLQVMWLTDWEGGNKWNEDGQEVPNVKYQRFLSYGEKGELKLWWHRPHIGFTLYRTLHLDVLSDISELTPRYRRITCVGSHCHDRSLLYIGSEDGKIYKYNTLYPVNTFDCILNAHRGPVTIIVVNLWNRDVFLSGGDDGMVKLWRGNSCTPIWGYWLVNPIADIKWSPFSSYVWTVVTRDNFVHIYNLECHFHEPMTSQHVLPYSSCVKVEFHQVNPLLMIADNYCNLFALKISRMAIEPEIVVKEDNWDPRKTEEEDDGCSFTQQRERLKRVLDKNEILVKSCTRINRGAMFEKQVKEAMAAVDRHRTKFQ